MLEFISPISQLIFMNNSLTNSYCTHVRRHVRTYVVFPVSTYMQISVIVLLPLESPKPRNVDFPEDYHLGLNPVLKEHERPFRLQLGRTNVGEHVTNTGDATPVKVPPRPVPFQYQTACVTNSMRWLLRGSIGQAIALGVSLCGLRATQQVHQEGLLPCAESRGPQHKLVHKRAFSKIDLRSAHWQFPMSETSIEKTAFCPGPSWPFIHEALS